MSKRASAAIVAVMCSAVALLVVAPVATAGDTYCVGNLPAGEYDNVIVPAGASCSIVGSTIHGNLTVEPGAVVVDIRGGTTIGGNVQGESFFSLDLHQATVGGSVQLKKFANNVQVCANTVAGDIQVEDGSTRVLVGGATCAPVGGSNTVGGNVQVIKNAVTDATFGMDVDGNSVAGSVQVYANTGTALKTVQGNTVEGVVQCFENEAPFVGTPNTGEGEGQCAP